MKHLINAVAIFLIVSGGASAVDNQNFDSVSHRKARSTWAVIPPRANCLELHSKYNLPELPVKIMIGHTVTGSDNSARILQSIQRSCLENKNSADIGYTTCFDKDGFRWDCREYKHVPAILQGHNAGSCFIGLIGNFHEEEVTDEMVRAWSHHIADIAFDLSFGSVERGTNIFAMSEKSQKYPISPGKYFMARFDEIVEMANLVLGKLQTEAAQGEPSVLGDE